MKAKLQSRIGVSKTPLPSLIMVGFPKRLSNSSPLTMPAIILWVWLGNCMTRASCDLLAMTPSIFAVVSLP